jgi:hypothetical protein
MVWRLCALAISVLLLLAMPVDGFAEGPARVYLQRAPLQDDKQLVVDVVVDNVADLYGAEIQLNFDPAQMEVQDANPRLEGTQIAPGPFLAVEDRFVVTNRVDAADGLITFVVTLLNPAAPASGSGVLATVAFKTVGGGPYSLKVTRAQLVSSALVSIPSTTEDLPLTKPANLAPLPPFTIPVAGWWTIGLAILLAAVMGVVALYRTIRTRATAIVSIGGTNNGLDHDLSKASATLAEQGRRAMERGDLEVAHELYSRAVEKDPANSAAWLGKGLVAQQMAERRICFERVLALDPGNSVAKVELQHIAGA